MPTEETIVPFAAPEAQLPPLSGVRSTLLQTSLQALRTQGYLDKYFEKLPVEHHMTMRSLPGAIWVPIELARAHYRACDAIDIPPSDLFVIGTDVAERIQGTFLGTIVRLAKGSGVTVWTGLSQVKRLTERVFQGAGAAVYKIGPKEARLVFAANELCGIRYFRSGLRGTLTGSMELFCRKAYVREVTATSSGVTYRASWA